MAETTRNNPWHLPEILSLEATRVRFSPPRILYAGTQRREVHEAVEILIRTGDDFPVRALSPALFVGETPIITYDSPGPNQYRFYVYDDFSGLQEGAPIFLGWPGLPQTKKATGFRYELGKTPPVA